MKERKDDEVSGVARLDRKHSFSWLLARFIHWHMHSCLFVGYASWFACRYLCVRHVCLLNMHLGLHVGICVWDMCVRHGCETCAWDVCETCVWDVGVRHGCETCVLDMHVGLHVGIFCYYGILMYHLRRQATCVMHQDISSNTTCFSLHVGIFAIMRWLRLVGSMKS